MSDVESRTKEAQDEEQTRSHRRLARYAEGLERLVAWRQPHADQLIARLKDDAALSAHVHTLDTFATQLGDAAARQAKGQATRLGAARELGPLWSALSSPGRGEGHLERVTAWHAGLPALPAGFEPTWLEHAFDLDKNTLDQWEIVAGRIGVVGLKPRPKPAGEDIGQRRDPLPGDAPAPMNPAPLDLCGVPSLVSTAGTTSGLAIVSASPSVRGASFSAFSSTAALIAMGGATDSSALAGMDVNWPSGFAELSIECDLDISFCSLFAIAVLGGATASAELVLQARLDTGAVFRTTTALGSAVAPLLWHTTISLSGPQQLRLGPIPLKGAAGSARLFAGVHDNTAAVGVVGSSAATTFIGGRVTRLCAHLR